jgi:hypothetical protein
VAKPTPFYKAQAKSIIKETRESQQFSYKELARQLETPDQPVKVQLLINQINDGTFSFALALQLLAAMGIKSIDIPTPPKAKAGKPR